MPAVRYSVPDIGTFLGRWLVLSAVAGKSGGVVSMRVRCACGVEKTFADKTASVALAGRSKQCTACSSKDRQALRDARLGFNEAMPDKAAQQKWLHALYAATNRCNNPSNAKYKWYGARGIRVHRLWIENRAEFLRYVRTLPGWDALDATLDRKDNSGGYVPGNIRCVTQGIQVQNTRQNVYVTYAGEVLCCAEFTRRYCPYIKPRTVRDRVHNGISPEVIIASGSERCYADRVAPGVD